MLLQCSEYTQATELPPNTAQYDEEEGSNTGNLRMRINDLFHCNVKSHPNCDHLGLECLHSLFSCLTCRLHLQCNKRDDLELNGVVYYLFSSPNPCQNIVGYVSRGNQVILSLLPGSFSGKFSTEHFNLCGFGCEVSLFHFKAGRFFSNSIRGCLFF
uniref:Uncharacterized protein n=2 Tax=Cacopsylla melanoneura TaxID=428564 RepID=A0A8D8VLL1_9HEMI